MRDLIRQIVKGYQQVNLEGQDEGFVVLSGEEPGSRQEVLIKILPHLLGKDPEIARRFDALAQAIRHLYHPNIATIRRIGEEGGLPYIVTKTLEKAQPLVARLNQRWAVDAAADVVMQVGKALDYAYRQGIVHGDLKPENILIADDGQVQVTDLGLEELAELVGGRVLDAASPFIAPERKEGAKADAPADVYSLAAILYAMLTNRPPQVQGDTVLPPGHFNADVPPEMDRIIVKALSPNPEDRYPSVGAFVAALGAVTLTTRRPGASAPPPGQRCPNCGAKGQTGRFCRKCGTRLPERKSGPPSKLDEPIQITKIGVGKITEVGKGIEMQHTVIARPMTVATGEMLAEFPEPPEMPAIDPTALWAGLDNLSMPEPLPFPSVDWSVEVPPMPEPLDLDQTLAEIEEMDRSTPHRGE